MTVNCKTKSKPVNISNTPYRSKAFDGLRRRMANERKNRLQPCQKRAMKWSVAIRLEMELMAVELHTEISIW
jgi:hypothetical protein